ncbi:MAG TPA: MBOAT family O-acyltransferase [Gemmatimonadaceae bacterium]|nr:MBOAT family O-acyltransferase [Gemmatimonadaceae bacterium]
MSLVSVVFLFGFLPIVVIGTHLLRDFVSAKAAQAWILGASLVFYAGGSVRFLPLLLASAAFNWGVGRALSSPRYAQPTRKRIMIFGLTVDVLVLCVAKYTNFIVGIFGGGRVAHWAFPLGISFFTIAQVMYLVDAYERLIPASSAFDHFTFASFFPNVTAGPLERVKHFVGQLNDIGGQDGRDERLARGIALMAIGLFKKAVIADSFARVADAGYANVATLSIAGAWLTSLAYTFQLYFDFSGYSDLAIGAARLLGIRLVNNFNAPYRSRTMSEYWQRWHISLSNFITTYLYTPIIRSMGRGRVTVHKACVASLLAMTIAGFWHGPAWTFVLWGTLQGAGIAAYQYWKRLKRPMPDVAATIVTFLFINLTMVVFRSPSVPTALTLAGRLVYAPEVLGVGTVLNAIPSAAIRLIALPIAFGGVVAFAGPTSSELVEGFQLRRRAAAGVAVAVAVSVAFIVAGTGSDFVYRAF